MRPGLAPLCCAVVLAAALAAPAADSAVAATLEAGKVELVGALHEHSGYSDGAARTRPSDSFARGLSQGLSFMGSSEHGEVLSYPVTVGDGCLDVRLPTCATADAQRPADSFRKWDATLEQARAASRPGFTAFRGFEWSSPAHGHINVFLSANFRDSYVDGSEVAGMDAFWRWFVAAPGSGGGGDGLGTFNHPGFGDDDRWEDFRHVPAADERMVGIETLAFRTADYGSTGGPAGGPYARALDRGWHVGAIGAEDEHTPSRAGAPTLPKTVIEADENSVAGIRSALLARRFYAVAPGSRRLTFRVGGQPMGSRLERRPGEPLRVQAGTNDPFAVLELVTSGGRVVASGTGALDVTREASSTERWYFLRVRSGDDKRKPVAYSSPVWVQTAGAPLGAAGGKSSCRSRRTVTVAVPLARGDRVRRARALVRARGVPVTARGRRARIDLRGLTAGRAVARVTVLTRSGRSIKFTRSFRLCAPGPAPKG